MTGIRIARGRLLGDHLISEIFIMQMSIDASRRFTMSGMKDN